MSEDPRERAVEVAPPAAEYHYRPEALSEALKRTAAALRAAEVPFMLAGSMACWVRGGPEPFTKDVDFCVRPEDADRALDALASAGMTTARPPEGWLFKAWDEDILVDLLFAPANVPVTDKTLERSDEMLVLSVPMRVAAIDDVMATKLLALNENSIDLKQLLQIGRALREQIDWAALHQRTRESPFAMAYFTLVEKLGVVGADQLEGAEDLPPAELPAPEP
jgi:Nucleotidyl transferase of unknown function (DUF2204)